MEERFGKIMMADSDELNSFDRGGTGAFLHFKLPLRKYVITSGTGFVYAIRKGKEPKREVVSGVTPCHSGHGIMETINRNGRKVFHLFDAEGEWLYISTLYDAKDREIGFHIWLEDELRK